MIYMLFIEKMRISYSWSAIDLLAEQHRLLLLPTRGNDVA